MSFEETVERLKSNPNVIVEGVQKHSQWRKLLLDQQLSEMRVDRFLMWNKENPSYYKSFEATTLDAISRGENITAIAVMDKIGCDHNWMPELTRVFNIKHPQYNYFRTKSLKNK